MMNSKTFRSLALAACVNSYGEQFNEEVFTSAFEKLKRHMKNKYGSLDWQEEHDEGGVGNLLFFYAESAKGVQQTWNGAKAAKPVVSIVPVAPAPATAKPARTVTSVEDAIDVLADATATEAEIEAALALLA